ncbi:DUF7344 domain-containing protein [Haladaptatus halobius]|uniref:DUF7344 domain-containing protein n=1 Tax=Haladaptatus halobius TaxID=2884875 RepID=UPI001D09DEBC|nr:hypothetical protein [Haladaptatus halobius]
MTSLDTDHTSNPISSLETACDLLVDTQRRTILQYLSDQETDIAAVDELAAHVHAEIEAVPNPNHARIALVHTHVPKLVDTGVIEYDQHDEIVQYQDEPLLEAILAVAATYDA